MNLYLDFGNSSLKAYIEDRGRCVKRATFSYKELSLDRFTAFVSDSSSITLCYVGTVCTKEKIAPYLSSVIGLTGCEIRHLNVSCAVRGVVNGYSRTEELGIDRWAAIVATAINYPLPALVIDCGTAVNVELISSKGIYIGGYIFPGLPTWHSAFSATERIVLNDRYELLARAGQSTNECVSAAMGCYVTAIVHEVVHQAVDQVGEISTVVLTGGDAELLKRPVKGLILDQDLVFKGMLIISENEL